MTNIVEKQSSALVAARNDVADMPIGDYLIPRVLLMQGQSEFVQERKATIGDMVRSTNYEKLGDDKNPLTIIPLKVVPLWRNEELVGKKYEFRSNEPRTRMNEKLPWEYVQNGVQWRRVQTLDCYCLLEKDVDADKAQSESDNVDLSKMLGPVVIRFSSLSFNASKLITTQFLNASMISAKRGVLIPPFRNKIVVGCRGESNDKGSFFLYMTTPGPVVNEYESKVAMEWYEQLNTRTDLRVDEVEESTSDVATTSSAVATERF